MQFLSGKILDVFHDEFIKFVPPYLLKREEERRRKMEEEAGVAGHAAAQGLGSASASYKTVQNAGAKAVTMPSRQAGLEASGSTHALSSI